MDVDEEKWMEFQVEHKHWHGLVGLNGLVFMLYIQCNAVPYQTQSLVTII